jgi:hypothetical protein
LVHYQVHGLERKLAVAGVEESLERRPEEIQNHRLVATAGAESLHKRHADATSEGIVDLTLIHELGMLGLDGFELGDDHFAGNNIDAQVDITWTTPSVMPRHNSTGKLTERTATNLFAKTVFTAHTEVHAGGRRGGI